MRSVLLFSVFLTSLCLAGPPLRAVEPEPYMRVSRESDGTTHLEIALRRLKSPREGAPEIWLSGVAHLGSTNYFSSLQDHLGEMDLVLFEGVGDPDQMRRPSTGDEDGLQPRMAKALGLAFQLATVRYDRPNFEHCDLSLEDMIAIFSGEEPSSGQPRHSRRPPSEEVEGVPDVPVAVPQTDNPEFNKLVGVLEGTSLMGAIAQFTVDMVGSSPRLQVMTRLMMAEVLGGLRQDLSQAQGLPENMAEMMKVIVQTRNDHVLARLRELSTSTGQDPSPKQVSVFYGAAHMADIERRLVAELDYAPAENRWLRAFSVDPRAEGLSRFEIRMVRSMVRLQLRQMEMMFRGPSEKKKELREKSDEIPDSVIPKENEEPEPGNQEH